MNQTLLDSETKDKLYKVLHDLNAPVRSMGGLLRLIRNAQTEAEREEYLQPLEKCYYEFDNRLQALLDSFQGEQESIERIHLNEYILQIFQTLSFLPGAGEIRFSLQDQTQKPFYGPPQKITSIFQNLIENSIKYRSRQSPQISISLYDIEYGIKAIVSDNGIGIPYHKQQSIFSLFSRSDHFREGGGIGLYNVKTTLDNLRGHIELESEPNNGTTFTLYIPSY